MVKASCVIIGIILIIILLFWGYYKEIKKKKMQNEEQRKKREREIETAILVAIEEKSFKVFFQPVFSKFDEMKAAEALVRLYDSNGAEIVPAEFIPVAEKMGHMVKIGSLVLDQVALFIAEHDLEKLGIQYIEVNVSNTECANPDFADTVMQVLSNYDIDYRYINIQIPEIALKENRNNLVHNMHVLNDLGVTFSLDDYGTGKLTLAYLMTLPFQFVKIDRSVLWDATKNRSSLDVLKANINTLKDFSMKIVVEGVESKEMADLLKKIGCDYLQGYYYSIPLPSQDFVDFCLTSDKG